MGDAGWVNGIKIAGCWISPAEGTLGKKHEEILENHCKCGVPLDDWLNKLVGEWGNCHSARTKRSQGRTHEKIKGAGDVLAALNDKDQQIVIDGPSYLKTTSSKTSPVPGKSRGPRFVGERAAVCWVVTLVLCAKVMISLRQKGSHTVLYVGRQENTTRRKETCWVR